MSPSTTPEPPPPEGTAHSSGTGPTPLADSSLPIGFGAATATFVVIASMVGVGVLTTSGYTVAAVGSNQLMIWLWLLGGVVALCGALTVAELSTTLPASGGDYVYIYEAYGPLAAFLSGWASFLVGFAAPIAASAFASGSYLLGQDAPDRPKLALATAAILILAAIHNAGRAHTVRVHSTITLLKLGVLIALAMAGLVAGRGGAANLNDLPHVTPKLAGAALFSLIYISYGYTGWNAASYLAGEVREPSRTLPRAILFGTGLVVALYLALNTFYALALPAADVQSIAERQGFNAVAPIAKLATERIFGGSVSRPLSIAIGVTLLASLSAYILTGPRVMYAMARAGHFPAFAGRLTKHSQTPAAATIALVAWALVLLWSGSFESIVVYAGVGLAVFSMLSVSSVFALRWRRPELPRPFRTPGYPVTPAFFLVVTALLTGAAFYQRPKESLFSLLSIVVGVPVYYLGFTGRKPAKTTDELA